MKRSNCLIHALTAWLRRAPPGEETYLVVRRIRRHWLGMHFLLGRRDPATGQIAVSSFKPPHDDKNGPLFRGSVVEGDAP